MRRYTSSLPHRQLRKRVDALADRADRSLPHRQLRNMGGVPYGLDWPFAAAQAA